MKANVVASGIIEIRRESEVILDDIKHTGDEIEEERRTGRDKRTGLNNILTKSGEKIRDLAMNRNDTSNTDT